MIKWICDVCTQLIADGEGYVHTNLGDAVKARQFDLGQDRTVLRIVTFDDLAKMPRRSRWRTHHEKCLPFLGDSNDYWMDVERLRTWRQIAHWSAHLSGKNWFAYTDWTGLVYATEHRCGP